MSAGYAPCSCQQAEELTARVHELEALLETAAAELDKRDEHLAQLKRDISTLEVRITKAVVVLADDKRQSRRLYHMACGSSTEASLDRTFTQFEAVSGVVDRALSILAPKVTP